ncbi:hypothetical protein [Sphingomonas sp.]|jgi:hypothetical protein|uniref:hypothetical protein n=1 Tax=Sphingomonas sp. TaxID=28214 RepID=UPI002ED99164
MTTPTYQVPRRDWRAAARALRTLLANGDDTAQVFVIMRSLNGNQVPRQFAQLMATPEGPRLAYRRVELAERFPIPPSSPVSRQARSVRRIAPSWMRRAIPRRVWPGFPISTVRR